MTGSQPPQVELALGLAGAHASRLTGNTPLVPEGSGLVVVAEGIVDAFFVRRDERGRVGLPVFVQQLACGDVVVRDWWTEAELGLPDGGGILRAVGEATIVDVPLDGELPQPLSDAVVRWRETIKAFADRAANGGGEAAQLALRQELDDALARDSERNLLRVFQFGALARRPPGLSALARVLCDAADAAGSGADPDRMQTLARAPHEHDTPEETAAQLRIPIRKVTLGERWWARPGQPLVVFRDGEPAALVPARRGYVFRDASGSSMPLNPRSATGVEPAAYAVYPRLPDRPLTLRDLLRLGFHGGQHLLLALVALIAVAAALGVILPYATGQIVGEIVPAGGHGSLQAILVALVAFTVAALGATVLQALAVLALSSRAASGLTAATWDRLLHVPPSFFRNRASGQLAQQVTAFDQMRTLISSSLVAALASSALSFAAIGLLISYSPSIALIVILIFLLTLAVGSVFVAREGRWLQTVIDDRNRLNGLLLGLFSGISKLRVAGAERRAHALWQRGYAFQQEAQRNSSLETVHLAVLQGLLPALFLLGVLIASATLDNGTTSVTAFSGSVAAAGQLAIATASMFVVATTLVQLGPLYRSAHPILETAPEVHAGAPLPEDFEGALRLDDVTFGYADGAVILDGVSFEAPAGSLLAIVGRSGAGKSTIVRIMLGFEQPWQGEVLLDDHPINSLDVEAMRRRMGTVIQGARITAGTILTNILGALPLPQEAAWEAAELAGVANDIRAMPMQMSTAVPEGGSGFSGGQLQRLLLARALVRKPQVLILDEATSALDNETQRTVMDHLGELGMTRIVIAHRLSTVQRADSIVVLDRGKVVENGSFDELMEYNGLFASLARRQML